MHEYTIVELTKLVFSLYNIKYSLSNKIWKDTFDFYDWISKLISLNFQHFFCTYYFNFIINDRYGNQGIVQLEIIAYANTIICISENCGKSIFYLYDICEEIFAYINSINEIPFQLVVFHCERKHEWGIV